MLTLLKDREPPKPEGDVCVVSMVKNEQRLIGPFLQHYQSIGARDFVFIDNGSTDGTVDFLMSISEARVYSTSDNYADARYGMDWIERALHDHAMGRWGLYSDCDEHLVFPSMERQDINQFAAQLGEEGYDAASAIMIDMYHDGALKEPVSEADTGDVYQVFPYFDADYAVRWGPLPPWKPDTYRHLEVFGGPRTRLLSSIDREMAKGWFDAILSNQIDRFIDKVPSSALRTLFKLWPICMPAQHKTPLNLVTDGLRYPNAHVTNARNQAPVMLGMLHFKFYHELARCFQSDEIIEHHYRRGFTREQLRLALLSCNWDTLMYEGSRRYSGPADLEECGIIGEHPVLAQR